MVKAHLCRGTSLMRNRPHPGIYSGIRQGPYGGPKGGAVSYERGIPVAGGTPPGAVVEQRRRERVHGLEGGDRCCSNTGVPR